MNSHQTAVASLDAPVLASRLLTMHADRNNRVESSREELVRRMAAGDQAAMAELYDQTNRIVFGLALRVLADRAAAEDVMVEVYAQVWRQAADYDRSRGSPSAWLLTVTRSRAIDARRARGRDKATEPLDVAGDLSSDSPGPEALTAAAERHRFVQGALAQLSGELRELIDLAYFSGMSHSEIATALGQPLGTVKTRIRSAMMQLRSALAPLNAPLPAVKEDG
ncbi:MAG: sigma-70 family RNA polymerase sigma factor, partial [bacterium]